MMQQFIMVSSCIWVIYIIMSSVQFGILFFEFGNLFLESKDRLIQLNLFSNIWYHHLKLWIASGEKSLVKLYLFFNELIFLVVFCLAFNVVFEFDFCLFLASLLVLTRFLVELSEQIVHILNFAVDKLFRLLFLKPINCFIFTFFSF